VVAAPIKTKGKMMHDLIIRNETIIDGTGNPCFKGDVAIDGKRATVVGEVSDRDTRQLMQQVDS